MDGAPLWSIDEADVEDDVGGADVAVRKASTVNVVQRRRDLE
jgi:hypothetical protein